MALSLDEALGVAALDEGDKSIHIDFTTRQVVIPESEKLFGVESDDAVEVKHIVIDGRYTDAGKDISELSWRVNFRNANGDKNVFPVTKVTAGDDSVEFDWIIRRSVVAYKGSIDFVVCAFGKDTDGKLTPEWNSTLGHGDVLEGLEVDAEDIGGDEILDELKSLQVDMKALSDSAAKSASDAKAALDAIPEDYTELSEDVEQLKEDLGDVESATFTIEKGSTNVFDYTNITSGKILKRDIGISTSETYQDSAKGFVANQTWNVKKGDVIYTTSAYCGLCVYDANGVLQEHFNDSNKNHTITVDSAHFLRLYSSASSATYTTDFMLSINEPLPSNHEEYKPDKKISNFIKLEEKTNENGQNIKDLSKSINGIELSQNLLDNSSVIENKRPSNWAGQTINDSYKTDGYYTFKAIPVTQNSTYYFVENGDLVNFGQLATYDKNGKYVSMLAPSTLNVNGVNVGYIIPENIAYVRGESKTSNFSNVNFKLFNGRFEKKFLKYNESAYEGKKLPVVVFDFDQVVEIDARFTILKKYGFVGNVVEVATNNYEITKKLIRMGYDISPYLGNHTWDYSTEDGIQKLTANIAEKLGGLEAIGVYNPTMISCSGHKYSDTMEKILSSYKIDYVRCSGFIKDGVSLKKSIYENSYNTRIVVPIGLGSYNGVDEFNGVLDTLVDGNVPLIMPFMHTFTYDADWITEDAFEKIVSHVSDLVKNGKALCMNMHDFVAYNDTVKSIHDDYVRNMSAIFN